MDILSYIQRIDQLYGSEQQVASLPYGTSGTYGASEELSPMPNIQDLIREEGIQVGPQVKAPRNEKQVAGLSESFPGTFTSYQDAVYDGFQGTREEWLQQQSIPQIDRPFTGKAGGRVYDTRKYFKPGGLVEPRVGYYKGKLVKTGPETGQWAVKFPEGTEYFKTETLANKGIEEYHARPRKESKARILFTKKEQKVAEALAKKKGISVKDLDGQDRKYIRDKFYTLENLAETKTEKNLRAGKKRKLTNLKEWQPIDRNTNKVYTEKNWLSLSSEQRSDKISEAKDPEGFKKRLKESRSKDYQKHRIKRIEDVRESYYEKEGQKLAAKRRPHKDPGTGGLQQERNRFLHWLKKSAEAGNKRYETIYDGDRFVGVLDKNSDRIYREVPYKDTEYKGKHISIENHPDYKKVYNPQWKTKGGKPGFIQLAKQFKNTAPDTVLGSYFVKHGAVPSYSDMYNYLTRDPRSKPSAFKRNALEIHHRGLMAKSPTKNLQLTLWDKNNAATSIIKDYKNPQNKTAYKNLALANKKLEEKGVRALVGREVIGAAELTGEEALGTAKRETVRLLK